jgi:anti-anti-sigma factor
MTDRAHRQETRIRLLPDYLQQPDGRYVRKIIDRHRRPVIADLTTLSFCDARGPAALVRMAGYAEQMGCTFRLASPSLSLVKIIRITGLDRSFFAFQVPEQAAGLACPEPSRLPLTRPVREVPKHG